MRDIRNHSTVTLLTAVLLAGCGGVHGIQIDATAKRIAEDVCSKAWVCCSVDQLKNNASSGADVATTTQPCTDDRSPCVKQCETKTAEDFRHYLADIQRSVDQKRALYEDAKVEDCLSKIRQDSCDQLNMVNRLTSVPGCDVFTTPLVTMGGACGQDYECTSGWCKAGASGGDGTCEAPMSGMSCAVDGCGHGFTCDGLGTTEETDDVCVAVQENGATCTGGIQCKSGNCSASGGAGMICQPAVNACFYGSGCSAVGGRPGVVSLLLLSGLLAFTVRRTRRGRRESI
jgi:hypothetical protein